MAGVIRKSVAFEGEDEQKVVALQNKLGLGERGFSAALRIMIRAFEMPFGEERFKLTAAGHEALNQETVE